MFIENVFLQPKSCYLFLVLWPSFASGKITFNLLFTAEKTKAKMIPAGIC